MDYFVKKFKLRVMHYRLKNIEVPAYIGVYESEKGLAQTLLINVDFFFDANKAALSDALEDTIDYSEIEALVRKVCLREHFQLLEKLHQVLIAAIEESFPQISELSVSLEKFPFESGSIILK